jgi:NTP pyrophosphatase (non-canonical NTP hydrolase)
MKTNLSKVKDALIQSDAPHYFEIKNEDGKRYCHLTIMTKVDTEKYLEFVKGVTSAPSLDWAILASRLTELEVNDANVTQLLTAALGLTAESGEFTEVVKKIFLQGKPYNEENVFHMKRELGDICWYLAQACMALDTTFDEVIEMNVDKLKARYPGGEFDVHYSENRKEGDL